MRYSITTIAATMMLLAGCDNLTTQQRTAVGLTGGAAAGLIAAEALDAGTEWRLISALAGAAAGTVVAQNSNRTTCAYARGDGAYHEAPCP